MIQDIKPHLFNNDFKNTSLSETDKVIVFNDNSVLVRYDDLNKQLILPEIDMNIKGYIYLFSLDDNNYYLSDDFITSDNSFGFIEIHELRKLELKSNEMIFALYSAYHLHHWYTNNKYCGACGHKTIHHQQLRALRCPDCNNIIFPRINPAVIIGVINGDKLLLTRYKTGFNQNALVAGFVEFGETLEETVKREVKEEVGINVKNIRYYKSQPWGIAQDLLAGFYCEIDGDDTIRLDQNELKYADWVKREDIVLQDKEYSLTNEMMKMFKENKIK